MWVVSFRLKMSSGVGGDFKDHRGTFLLHFEKQVSTKLAIYAEILAMKEGLLIRAASRWATSANFVI